MHPYQTLPRWRYVARYLAVAVGALLLLAAMGLLLLTLRPGWLGRDPQLTAGTGWYAVDGIQVAQPGFSLNWEEGRIRPVRQEGQVVAALFEGEGELTLTSELVGSAASGSLPPPHPFAVNQAFLSLETGEWEALIAGQPALQGSSTASGPSFLAAALEARPQLPAERLFSRLPGIASRTHYLVGPELEFEYRAEPQITVRVRQPGEMRVYNLTEASWLAVPVAPAPRSSFPLGTAGLVVGFLVISFLAWMFTADLRHRRQSRPPVTNRPVGAGWLVLLVVLPGADLGLMVAAAAGAPWGPLQTLKLGAIGAALLLLALGEVDGLRRLGLTGGYALRGLAAGTALAFLALAATHLDFPYGLVPERLAAWPREAFVAFVELGLLTEIYRRGFLQRELERRAGPWLALAGVTLFSALLALLLRETDPVLASLPLWAAFVLAVLSPLIYGLLLLRTRNIWGGTLARGLYEWLSRILLFG